MNKPTGRGRRAGNPDTRELIRTAARQRFLAEGYQSVTMRSIAADAGVDVALVSYYFGSKRGLFGAALALNANPTEIFQSVLAGDLDTLAVRLLRALLTAWDTPETGDPLRAYAVTATVDPHFSRLTREIVSREIVDRLAERLGGPRAGHRAAAFIAQVVGIIFSRYVVRLEPIASMSADDVVRHLAPALRLVLQPTSAR